MAPAQFDQLILNLALNGRDAMGATGRLTITLEEVAGSIVLIVRDTGEGMDPETAARCFEPFFTTKGATRGTGLGLATVYSVVTGAGGQISVDTRPGGGTTFTVEFPAVEGEAPTEQPEPRPATKGSGRILLAEDEDGLRQLASEVLRGAGYVVAPVPDGQAAIELLDSTNELPDLLVTDVVMPRMNGVELARELHARAPDIPVLFVSGYAETATREDLRGAEVLIKPFLLRDLTAKVHDVLERAAQTPAAD
jgi:CheY-like chemotaxis protein